MAVLLDAHHCPSCHQRHDFFLPDVWDTPAAVYSFVCPVAHKPVELELAGVLGSPVIRYQPGSVWLGPVAPVR